MKYVIDIDGTICNEVLKPDGKKDYELHEPMMNRIEKVNKLYDAGHTIKYMTARGCVSGKNYFFFTMDQLKSWGIKFHTLRTGVKFGADLFIDDKGISDESFFTK